MHGCCCVVHWLHDVADSSQGQPPRLFIEHGSSGASQSLCPNCEWVSEKESVWLLCFQLACPNWMWLHTVLCCVAFWVWQVNFCWMPPRSVFSLLLTSLCWYRIRKVMQLNGMLCCIQWEQTAVSFFTWVWEVGMQTVACFFCSLSQKVVLIFLHISLHLRW